MTNMDKMAEKIQNLLNKTTANGATEEEAKSALLMAQKLMAKYNIDLAATTGNKELKCSLEQTKVKANPRNNSLGWIIAKSFAVKNILIDGKHAFFGREADAKAAASALIFVHKVMEAGMRKVCRRYGLETTQEGACLIYNPYAQGFIAGLNEAMSAQTKALAIVVPEEVNKAYEERFPVTRNYRAKGMQRSYNPKLFNEGHEDGHSAMDKRSLSAG